MASETRTDAGRLSRNAEDQSNGKELDPGLRRDDEVGCFAGMKRRA